MGDDIPYEKQLSLWIRACEERFISYKKMLEELHRDKATFSPDDPIVMAMKDDMRWAKNMEEARLKELREEKTYYPCMTPTTFNAMVARHVRISQVRGDIAVLERLSLQVPADDRAVIIRILQALDAEW